MKKIVLTLAAAILMAVSVAGCGGSGEAPSEATPTEVTSVQSEKQVEKAHDKEENSASEKAEDTASNNTEEKAESDDN